MKIITVTGIILQFDADKGVPKDKQVQDKIDYINRGLAMFASTNGNAQLIAMREDIDVEESEVEI